MDTLTLTLMSVTQVTDSAEFLEYEIAAESHPLIMLQVTFDKERKGWYAILYRSETPTGHYEYATSVSFYDTAAAVKTIQELYEDAPRSLLIFIADLS